MFLSSLSTVHRLIIRLAIVMLAVAALLIGIVFYSGKVMDSAALANQQALIDNAFSARLLRANSELRSVAWWDEAVTKSSEAGFDREWLDLEVGAFMTESYEHDQIAILDERNRLVYEFGEDDASRKRLNLAAIQPLVDQVRGGRNVSPRIIDTNLLLATQKTPEVTDRKTGRSAGAIVKIAGKPVMVSVMAITPSVDYSLLPLQPRLLVSYIAIDHGFLSNIGSNTLLKELKFATGPSKASGSLILRSDTKDYIGRLTWVARQPGSQMVRKVLPWILSSLLIAVGLMAFLLVKLARSTSQLAAREADARFSADHDALTGLPNRRLLETLFNSHFEGSGPLRQKIAVARVDLDRFKDINDTLGHHAGDELIKAVAARLQSKLLLDDTLARLGGDEFAIMRPVRNGNGFDDISELVVACFSESFAVTGHQIEANASIGLAFAVRGDSFVETIKRADIALYDAKANGRGRLSLFTNYMAEEIERRHSIQVDLKRAIAARELTLNYQPIVEAASGAITSVEALLRWTSPTHGSVPPNLFVSIAEEVGLMADLGKFVIEQAIEDAQRWPDLTTAINISPAQLRSATILSDLLDPANRFGVSPSRLTIEITESVLMSNDDRTLRVLNELKKHGFTLALDDFGTGYSSLAYIRDFPFDKLKIDRSFVQGLSANDRAIAIVDGVVKFGKILGREIVAEGIETEGEMHVMQRAGATHLQGFLFSRALPADHIEAIAATFGGATQEHGAALPAPKAILPIASVLAPRKARRV